MEGQKFDFDKVIDEIESLVYDVDAEDENYFSNIATKLDEYLEKGYIYEAPYNYFYGLSLYFIEDYEAALTYMEKSHDDEPNYQTTKLIMIIERELGNYERALEYGFKCYDINSGDDQVITKIAEIYCELRDISNAYEMIKDIDIKKDDYYTYLYIFICIQREVLVNQNKDFREYIFKLFDEKKEEYKNYTNMLILALESAAEYKKEKLSYWIYGALKLTEIWQDDYKRFYTYYTLTLLYNNLKNINSLELLFKEILLDVKICNDDEYIQVLTAYYTKNFYDSEHRDFKMKLNEYLSKNYEFSYFVRCIDHTKKNQYLEYLFKTAVEKEDREYILHYGYSTLRGEYGIEKDLKRAKELLYLSNELYKREKGEDYSCVLRDLSTCEYKLGNYDKATEYAYKSAINSYTYCNCGVAELAQLLLEGKTKYDVSLAKELILKSIDGYFVKENFTYEKVNHTNIVTIEWLYAYLALKGEKGFSKFDALHLLKTRNYRGGNSIPCNYYIARLLKETKQDYNTYYNKFLELLKDELEIYNTLDEQNAYRKHASLDDDTVYIFDY